MLPAIGSVSTLASQGRIGVVVAARTLGEPEDGRQLVALRIRTELPAADGAARLAAADGTPSLTPRATPAGGADAGRSAKPAPRAAPAVARLPDELGAAARAELTRLQQRDQQVRQEEKAHAAVAGDLAGPISYTYQRGPDGRQYAVGGSVAMRASTLSGDPAEARRLGARMAAAANAATHPSAQDYATARQAYAFGSQLAGDERQEHLRPGLDILL